VIDEVPLLSPEEAREVVRSLDAIRSSWLIRDGRVRAFATLGRAAYLDLCGGRSTVEEYRRRAAEQNEHLRRHFADLLEMLRSTIADRQQTPAVLTRDWALPGFHIFTGPGLRGAGAGGAHFDLQFRELVGDVRIDHARVLSFTLALELPEAGSGLRVWPIRPAQLHGCSRGRDSDERLIDYLGHKPSVYVRYQIGRLYIQREPILHCIWNGEPIRQSDRRITLQGHALEQNGTFVLYW